MKLSFFHILLLIWVLLGVLWIGDVGLHFSFAQIFLSVAALLGFWWIVDKMKSGPAIALSVEEKEKEKKKAGIALFLHFLLMIVMVIFGGGFFITGALFFDDPRASFDKFLLHAGAPPLVLLITFIGSAIAYASKKYRMSINGLAIAFIYLMLNLATCSFSK